MTKPKIFLQARFYMYLIIFILAAVAIFLGFYTLMEYRPNQLEKSQLTSIENAPKLELQKNQPIKLATWNIGYAGLDAPNDFILDGGTKVFARSKEAVEQNLSAFAQTLADEKPNIVFLQEVDEPSKRSYWTNEREFLTTKLNKQSASFAVNFDVFYIPYPFPNMLGKTKGGILTLSDYLIDDSVRHQLPGSFPWPKRTVYLKRCLSVNSSSVAGTDKKLYFINLHLSAYDKKDKVRPKEMQYLKDLIQELYAQGHWVIAGGDWNAIFPNTEKIFANWYKEDANKFKTWQEWSSLIEDDYISKDWHWIYDEKVATVRDLHYPFKKGETLTSIIDGFLASPNIEVLNTKTLDLDFKSSDHQPVFTQIELK